MVSMGDSARISPTAYYTGHVWYRNDLSDKTFYTRRGHSYFLLLQPFFRMASMVNKGVTMENLLLQRHRLIDHLLTSLIQDRGICDVVEIASGLSPRGLRFKKEFGDRIQYIEADLPDMAAHKQQILGNLSCGHHVVPVDATTNTGPLSIQEVIEPYLGNGPVIFITEGLLPYFPREIVSKLWNTFSALMESRGGVYLSNIILGSSTPEDIFMRTFHRFLSRFVKGKTYLHFQDQTEIVQALNDAGFEHTHMHAARDYAEAIGFQPPGRKNIMYILEASK